MTEYIFSLARPPLLELEGDVFSIAADALSAKIGEYTVQDETELPELLKGPLFLVIAWTKRRRLIKLTRYKRWVVAEPPIHFAEDTTIQIEKVSGYKKTEKESIERSLSVSFGGSVPLVGLKADVKAGLKITNETVQEWKEETKVTVNQKFSKDTTYVNWNLIDSIVAEISGDEVDMKNGDEVSPHRPIQDFQVLNVVLRYYQDGMADPQRETLAQLNLAPKL